MGEEVPILDLETDQGFVDKLKKMFGMKSSR